MINFTPEVIAGFAALLLTLVFAYFPVLRVKFASLTSEVKSGIMLGVFALVSVVTFLLAFYGVIPSSQPLTWFDLVKVFVTTIIISQPAYTILPKAYDVKATKLIRDYATLEETFKEEK
jgi:hypothetical protein